MSKPGLTSFGISAERDTLLYIPDEVLPITHCSWRPVPRLEAAGYEVTTTRLMGHTVPAELALEAVTGYIARPEQSPLWLESRRRSCQQPE